MKYYSLSQKKLPFTPQLWELKAPQNPYRSAPGRDRLWCILWAWESCPQIPKKLGSHCQGRRGRPVGPAGGRSLVACMAHSPGFCKPAASALPCPSEAALTKPCPRPPGRRSHERGHRLPGSRGMEPARLCSAARPGPSPPPTLVLRPNSSRGPPGWPLCFQTQGTVGPSLGRKAAGQAGGRGRATCPKPPLAERSGGCSGSPCVVCPSPLGPFLMGGHGLLPPRDPGVHVDLRDSQAPARYYSSPSRLTPKEPTLGQNKSVRVKAAF